MRIFDSHAHYDDPAFDPDRAELLAALPGMGVEGVINAGTTVATSAASAELARKYPYFYAAVGLHPEEAANVGRSDIDGIARLARGEKVVAIGEIGLDYHYEGCDRELQKELFTCQLELADSLGLPVVIHDRDAHGDTMEILRRFRPRGVLHCFSGSAQTALEAVSLGLYIGFTGAVTFKNNRKAQAVLSAVPRGRILAETDCPYMAPEPLRGRRSDSGMLVHTLGRMAEILGITPDEAALLTLDNAKRLYSIK